MKTADITIHFDGSCLPKNPGGTARYGFHITDAAQVLIHEEDGIVCKGDSATNNVAEWAALRNALLYVVKSGIPGEIQILGDSMLVINQLNGKWKCKKEHLQPYLEECLTLLNNKTWSADHIYREQNQHADDLSKGVRS